MLGNSNFDQVMRDLEDIHDEIEELESENDDLKGEIEERDEEIDKLEQQLTQCMANCETGHCPNRYNCVTHGKKGVKNG